MNECSNLRFGASIDRRRSANRRRSGCRQQKSDIQQAFKSTRGQCKQEAKRADNELERIPSILERIAAVAMDHLWSPWRFTYVTTAESAVRPGVPEALAAWPGDLGCVFCNLIASIDHAIANGMDRDQAEAAGGLVVRGEKCFVCLNAFPYTSGHVMAVPYAHIDRLAALPAETALELIRLAQKTERALERAYAPHGYNFGINIGHAAGAGVAGHLHLHAMPRWTGDTNFMTTVSETRVLPEDLDATWKRMRQAFREVGD
jgi:ATP adenylyltransferase